MYKVQGSTSQAPAPLEERTWEPQTPGTPTAIAGPVVPTSAVLEDLAGLHVQRRRDASPTRSDSPPTAIGATANGVQPTNLLTVDELSERLKDCSFLEYTAARSCLETIRQPLERYHQAASDHPGEAQEWSALQDLRKAANQAMAGMPAHFPAARQVREMKQSIQQRANDILPTSMTEAVPPNLHFVWIGGIREIQTEYIKAWARTNPGHDVTLWFDQEATLGRELAENIKDHAFDETARQSDDNSETKAAFVERVVELQDAALEFIVEGMNSPERPTFDQVALRFMEEELHFTPDRIERAENLRKANLASYEEFLAALERDRPAGQTARITTSPIRSLFEDSAREGVTGSEELFGAYMTEIGLRGSLAGASDVVRLMALRQSGGLYLDADLLPDWNHTLKQKFDKMCADIKAGPSWTAELKRRLWDEGRGLVHALTEAVLDKLGDAFPARQALRSKGRYESAMAIFPADIQRQVRQLVEAHANDAANEGRSMFEVWFQPLAPIKTAPDLMRLFCAQGRPSNGALVAQAGASGVDDALKTLQRNYRMLDEFASRDAGDEQLSREAPFRQALGDASRELGLAADISMLRHSDLVEYRTAFSEKSTRSQINVSGPGAQAEQLSDMFRDFGRGALEQSFAFNNLNLFTEEDRNSTWVEDAYADRIRRRLGDESRQPTAAHVAAVNQASGFAVEIQRLIGRGQHAEARAEANKLLEPELLAQFHSLLPSQMGVREAQAMNRAHVHYMDLLTALARQDLLDARQAFDRLLAAGTQKDHLPYLLHIASCIAATQEGREVAPLLAQSATRLLDALASAHEKTEGKSVRADMRKALLVQEHKVQVSPLGKDKYSKYVDFFARALLSDSPRYPAQASLIAARELQRNGLWPSGRELKDAGLSRQRADKFKTLERKASRPMGEFPQTQADLAVAARELKKLDLSGARAADAEQRAQEAEQKAAQQREDAANMAIIGAVRSAIDERWEPLARAARKELDSGPLPISAMLDPVATAAYAGAANSIPRTAPGRLVESVRDALMSTPEGKAVLQSLTRTGQPYRKEEQLEFDRALQGMVDARVGETLEGFERGLRASADKTIAESAARDAAVQARRKGEEDAALALDGARVRANAARALESRSGALSPARGESQAGRQGQAGQTTAPPQRQAEAQPSASEAELRERYENLRRADIEYQLSKLPSPPSGDPRDDAIEQRLANLRGTYNSEALVASMPDVPDTPIGNDRTRTAVPVEESGMTAAHW